MPSPDSNKRLLQNIFSLSLLQLANNFLPLIAVPVVVRIIGPEKYGVINFVSVVVTYFVLLTNYSFDLTATREIARNPADAAGRTRVFNEVFFAKLFLLAVSTVLFVGVVYALPELAAEKQVAVFTFITCISLVITPNWLYQGMQELYYVAVFNFVTKLLFTVFILFVVREESDYVWQPFMISISHVLVGVGSFAWAVKKYRIRLGYVPFGRVLRLLWQEKVIFSSFVAIAIYTNSSTLILGLVQTPTDVGFFTASSKLVIIMHTVVTIPLGLSLFPFIGESFGISKEAGVQKVKAIMPFVLLLTALMGAVVWLVAPFIITIFYGNAFVPAIAVLRILCFVPMVIGLSNLMGVQTMVNLKMDGAYVRITFVGALIGILLNIVLAEKFSYLGTAWAWLLTEASVAVIMWLYLYTIRIQIVDFAFFRYSYLLESIQPAVRSLRQKLSGR
ncbi:MAG: flippase [Cytophagales bacterium]|nr:flippase [Cytophagales bacterium]